MILSILSLCQEVIETTKSSSLLELYFNLPSRTIPYHGVVDYKCKTDPLNEAMLSGYDFRYRLVGCYLQYQASTFRQLQASNSCLTLRHKSLDSVAPLYFSGSKSTLHSL